MPLTPPPDAPPPAPDAAPPAPSRANPSTFRALADAFVTWQAANLQPKLADVVAWLETFVPWLTTHVDELNTLNDSVNAIAPDLANIDTVAGAVGNINTVAPAVANIGTVAGSVGSVNTVAANITQVNQALTASATAGAYPNSAAAAVPAGVAVGAGYWVTSVDGTRLDHYKNVGGVATADPTVASVPSWTFMDAIYRERLFAARGRWVQEKRTRSQNLQRPKCLVLVSDGQSNAANYNAPVSGIVSANAFQPSGGNAIGFWDFYSSNQEHSVHWDDIGLPPVQWQDTTTENALSGAIAVLDGVFPRIYGVNLAYGGNTILQLGGGGKRTNHYAGIHKMCDHARAAGYEPIVAVGTALQGEANMASYGLMDEATYYTAAMGYYRMLQMLIAQAMEQPGYEAPIVFFCPVQAINGDASRAIKNAIIRIANDIPNGILAGGIYPWPVNADLIHGTAVGFRERSEFAGWLLQRYFTRGDVFKGLKMVDAVSTGPTTKVITFNDEVVRDQSRVYVNDATTAPAGVEYEDAGNLIGINALAIAGRKITLTLASAPVGAANAQFVRVGTQTSPSNGVWPGSSSGSQIRSATDPGFLSLYDPNFRQYVWAAPQKFAVR
jgi:hypothetical protein